MYLPRQGRVGRAILLHPNVTPHRLTLSGFIYRDTYPRGAPVLTTPRQGSDAQDVQVQVQVQEQTDQSWRDISPRRELNL